MGDYMTDWTDREELDAYMPEEGEDSDPGESNALQQDQAPGPSHPPELMLDPSFVLGEDGFRTLKQTLQGEYPEIVFRLPATFVEVLDDWPSDQGYRFVQDLGARNSLDFAWEIVELFEHRRVQVYSPSEGRTWDDILGTMKDTELERPIARMTAEEWHYLVSQSWLLSRIKKPLNRMKQAGAVVLESARDLFDRAVIRTLDDPPEPIQTGHRLRAAAKWIAAAGAPMAYIIDPLAGHLNLAAWRFLVMADP